MPTSQWSNTGWPAFSGVARWPRSKKVELAHIDGGGAGALSTVWFLAERYAAKKGLKTVEWMVRAVHCAKPNLKLRRVLEMKGFRLKNMAGIGETYHYVHEVADKTV